MKKRKKMSQLMEYAGSYRMLIYLSWVLVAISAVLAFFPFVYIWKIIEEVLLKSSDLNNAISLVHKGWIAFLLILLSMFFYVTGLMCSHVAAFRVASNIRSKLSHHILKLPLNFVDDFGSGKLRKVINDSSSATETYLSHNLPDQTVANVTFVGLIFFLFYFDWRLGTISALVVIMAFIIMSLMTGKTSQEGTKKYNDALSDMSNESVEYVRGITVVKTFGQTVFSLKKFTSSIDRYQKFVIDFTKNHCFPMVIYTTIINSISVFLLMGALFFTKEGVTTEFTLNFSFYLIITPLISVVLSKIMYTSENKLVVSDALNRINEVLEKKPLSETKSSKIPQNHSIVLSNVNYRYNEKKTAIQNVSMCIESGEKVALVGESGSGKTTLANLVSRFFDAHSGTIEIGGVNVKDISKEHLMDTVSFVFQRNVLMKGSILENVRMGKEEATEQEVIAALQLAQCLDIIEKMPDGIHTVIGAEGSYLSGGEIQRIVIARAILKDAPILILDEATAFADADNEMRIQQALDELSKGKTVIMIAHRLSTVINVDKIFVLKSGKICESGTPQQLMDKKMCFIRCGKNMQHRFLGKYERRG